CRGNAPVAVVCLGRVHVVVGVERPVGVDRDVVVGDVDVVVLDREHRVDAVVVGDRDVVVGDRLEEQRVAVVDREERVAVLHHVVGVRRGVVRGGVPDLADRVVVVRGG